MPITTVRVKLDGENGNAVLILARVRRAMEKKGVARETIDEYLKEARAGDYNHLLAITMKYVNVY